MNKKKIIYFALVMCCVISGCNSRNTTDIDLQSIEVEESKTSEEQQSNVVDKKEQKKTSVDEEIDTVYVEVPDVLMDGEYILTYNTSEIDMYFTEKYEICNEEKNI